MIRIYKNLNLVFQVSLREMKVILLSAGLTFAGLGFMLGVGLSESATHTQNTTVIYETQYITKPYQEFSPTTLKEYLKEVNIKFPHIVYAQMVLETGYFTSNVFRENNNLSGMKQPSIRSTTAKGTKNGHAYYNNWMDSVDYALWQTTFLSNVNSDEEYLGFLVERGYAEDPSYIPKLETIMGRYDLAGLFY